MRYRARVVAAPSGARATVPQAKLQVPRLTEGVVLRNRLLDAMATDESGVVQVISVVAPAGSGKTILMSQRSAELTRAGRPVAWVSLDGGDNDPFVLWSAILLATARVADHGDVSAALRGLSPPVRASDTAFVTAFVDAFNVSSAALWLVLDDVHLINPGPALDSLAALLRNMPPHLRIMVGARHDPPLLLPRLLMEGRAAEIRFMELAFDRRETNELLARHDVRLAELALTESVGAAVVVLIFFILYQQVENLVIGPRVFASAVFLRPMTVFLAVLFGGTVGGFVGAIVALPIAAALKVVFRYVFRGQLAVIDGRAVPESVAPPSPQPRRS